MSERFFDDLARTLASPMPRRRALRLAGAALVTAAVPALRPRTASAFGYSCSDPNFPQKCFGGNGTQVCVAADEHCCTNALCASACAPWEQCSNGNACDATPALCTHPGAPDLDPTRTKFCSLRRDLGPSLCSPGGRTLLEGWCCRPDESCGGALGEPDCLECPENRKCGATECCTKTQYCAHGNLELCCERGKAGKGREEPCIRRDGVVGQCCRPGLVCKQNATQAVCCRPNEVLRNRRCACSDPKQKLCGAKECCDKKLGEVCSNGTCCLKGETGCGAEACCLNKSEHCSNGMCCPKGKTGCGEHCCTKGETCSRGTCCPRGRGFGTGASALCCPPGTMPIARGTTFDCCPPNDPSCCQSSCTQKGSTCVKGACVKL